MIGTPISPVKYGSSSLITVTIAAMMITQMISCCRKPRLRQLIFSSRSPCPPVIHVTLNQRPVRGQYRFHPYLRSGNSLPINACSACGGKLSMYSPNCSSSISNNSFGVSGPLGGAPPPSDNDLDAACPARSALICATALDTGARDNGACCAALLTWG